MEKPLRIEDKINNEILVRYVFGLNIFRVNKIDRSKNLELKFLEFVSRETLVSAHTGSLHDIADSPEELFDSPDDYTYYEKVEVGVFGGAFYSTKDWSLFPPCFFPKVSEFFWNIKNGSSDLVLEEILDWDALAIYVSPYDNGFANEIKSFFDMKFVSSEDWIKKALSLYRLIIVSTGDMNFFKVYANSSTDFDILNNSLRKTEEIILSNKWYQNNKNSLVWDNENNMCLILSNKSKV
jgi:hypothetical protein